MSRERTGAANWCVLLRHLCTSLIFISAYRGPPCSGKPSVVYSVRVVFRSSAHDAARHVHKTVRTSSPFSRCRSHHRQDRHHEKTAQEDKSLETWGANRIALNYSDRGGKNTFQFTAHALSRKRRPPIDGIE